MDTKAKQKDIGMSFKYWAFISYSTKDTSFVQRFHRELETFAMPRELIGKIGRDGPIPSRLFPIFRDRDELPMSSDLGASIHDAIRASRYLIVVCSPESAKSRWVNEEIRFFKSLGREDRVLAIIVRGEPNVSTNDLLAAEECFAPALRNQIRSDGVISETLTEPIAGDLRKGRDSRRSVLLKAVAGITGIGYEELNKRDKKRQRSKKLQLVLGISCVAFIITLFGVVALLAKNNEIVAKSEQQQARLEANKERSEKEQAAYFVDMLQVRELWKRSEGNRANDLLQKYKDFYSTMPMEWQYWDRVLNSQKKFRTQLSGVPLALAFGGDKSRLAILLADGKIVVLDPLKGDTDYSVDALLHRVIPGEGGWLTIPRGINESVELYSFVNGEKSNVSVMQIPMASSIAYDRLNRRVAVGDIAGQIFCRQPWGPAFTRSDSIQSSLSHEQKAEDITQSHRGIVKSLDVQNGAVTSLAYSHDGTMLGVGYENGTTQVWNVEETPTIKYRFHRPKVGEITGLAFDSKARFLAVQSNGLPPMFGEPGCPSEIAVVELNKGGTASIRWSASIHPVRSAIKLERFDSSKNIYLNPNPSPVFDLDDATIYTTGDLAIQTWDAESGRSLQPLVGHNSPVISVAVDGETGRIAGANRQGEVIVWDSPSTVSHKPLFKTVRQLHSFAISDDEKLAAVSFEASQRWAGIPNDSSYVLGVKLVELQSGKEIGEMRHDILVEPKTTLSLRFDQWRSKFAYLDPKEGVELKSMGQRMSEFENKKIKEAKKDSARDQLVAEKDLKTPMGNWLVETHGSWTNGFYLRHPNWTFTGESEKPFSCIAWTNDGKYVVAGFLDGTIAIWSHDGLLIHREVLSSQAITAVAISNDGKLVAGGAMDKSLSVFDVEAKRIISRCQGHRCEISGIAFKMDQSRLVSSSGLASVDGIQAGEVIVWDIQSGKICLWLELPQPCRFLDVNLGANGNRIYAIASRIVSQKERGDASIVVWDCTRPD